MPVTTGDRVSFTFPQPHSSSVAPEPRSHRAGRRSFTADRLRLEQQWEARRATTTAGKRGLEADLVPGRLHVNLVRLLKVMLRSSPVPWTSANDTNDFEPQHFNDSTTSKYKLKPRTGVPHRNVWPLASGYQYEKYRIDD